MDSHDFDTQVGLLVLASFFHWSYWDLDLFILLSVYGFIAAVFWWYNNTAYPSVFYGPPGPEASQAQGFTFLVRDQKLGISVASAGGLTALGKYLMRSPSGEIII